MINADRLDEPEPPAGTDPPCTDCVHDFADHHRVYSDAGCTIPGCICTLTQHDLTD